MQLGLRDLVVHQCGNFSNPSVLPPRMLPFPNTLIDQEEKIRAYWMTELLDGSSTMGAAWNLSISRPPMTTAAPSATSSSVSASYMAGYQDNSALYPCEEDLWTTAFPEFCISVASFEDLETSSSFTSYVNLVANELYVVHQFLQQPFDRRSVQGRAKWQAECKNVDERLQKWRAGSPLFQNGFKGGYYNPQYSANTPPGTVVNATPSAVTEISSLVNGNIVPTPEKTSFDPVAILSFAMYDMAIIALYQRLAFPANDIERPHGPFYHAIQRCLDASDELTTVVRSVSDADLENMSPHLIFPLFVAARFFLGKSLFPFKMYFNRFRLRINVLSACPHNKCRDTPKHRFAHI